MPSFGVKMDAVPGRLTNVWFEATRPGTYHFFCAQYCGTDHSRMIGQVVVMDNLSAHKGGRVRELIEERSCELIYLPPYSPDFNPIENAFAKLKANLRKAAERTVNGLWDAVGRIVDTYTPAESTNYFVAAGYLQPDRLTL